MLHATSTKCRPERWAGIVSLCLAMLCLVSCIGATYRYPTSLNAPIPAVAGDSLVVVVQDRRPLVVSESQPEWYVGTRRNLYGIPGAAFTKDNVPLASVLADVLAETFRRSGIAARSLVVSPKDEMPAEIKRATTGSPSRFLVITIHEWRTSHMVSTGFAFDVEGAVWNREMQTLAVVRSGPNDVTLPSGEIGRVLQAALDAALEPILADDGIESALRGLSAHVDDLLRGESSQCSREQIRQLEHAGMTEQQITLACQVLK